MATVFEAYFGCFEAGFIRLEGGISWVQNLDAVKTKLILKSSPLQFFVKLLKHGMKNHDELRMKNSSHIGLGTAPFLYGSCSAFVISYTSVE